MLFHNFQRAGLTMADSTIARETPPVTSQAELLYQAQQRKIRHFRANVALSWIILLVLLVYIFSGETFLGLKTIHLDSKFIQANIAFIARGIDDTLIITTLSILLAMVLALLAALGRLSTIPPIYAL